MKTYFVVSELPSFAISLFIFGRNFPFLTTTTHNLQHNLHTNTSYTEHQDISTLWRFGMPLQTDEQRVANIPTGQQTHGRVSGKKNRYGGKLVWVSYLFC